MTAYRVKVNRSPQASHLDESRNQCMEGMKRASWQREVQSPECWASMCQHFGQFPMCWWYNLKTHVTYSFPTDLLSRDDGAKYGGPRPLLIKILSSQKLFSFINQKLLEASYLTCFHPVELHWTEHRSQCWLSYNRFGTPLSWCLRRRKTSQPLGHRTSPWRVRQSWDHRRFQLSHRDIQEYLPVWEEGKWGINGR